MGRKLKNYTENYTDDYPELDGINNLVPKQQTIKLTEEEWSELNNGSKGSDDHISDISKMVEVPQQEISDEEILKQGNYFFPKIEDVFRKDIWEMGAKWYREQLKSKGNGK
jgi:hypothetical protein